MPEQGPTREEIEAQNALDALADYVKRAGTNGLDRAFLQMHKEASERLARARHIREAVEGLPKSHRGGVKVPGFWSDGEGMVCDPEHLIIALTKAGCRNDR